VAKTPAHSALTGLKCRLSAGVSAYLDGYPDLRRPAHDPSAGAGPERTMTGRALQLPQTMSECPWSKRSKPSSS
jgi:hypothetical protein